ncbi:hypothetical protein JM18_005653 [Phytophthora kernoviae]|uniref:Glycosyl transferase family 1 domain-containing protein n=2 Tax=Phytophthora kernoviae TaxID=325452 RepID=A0A921SGK4_9STRA|nr:hypothetical protein G195_006891 [Phytophthora kernoviae 00238/432]KAG2523754.1 hypothetical protein JM18_005653 [Phytophthora kernoviae]
MKKTPPPSQLNHLWLHRVLVMLVALGGLTLILEASSLFGASGDQLTDGSRLRRAIDIGISWRRINNTSAKSPTVDEVTQDSPSVKTQEILDQEVSEADLLHLSLLHEACVTDTNAAIPWQFGSPGQQLADGSASNHQELIHQNDTDLLRKLKQCPDVDVFLPQHLHGNGYCEDAVAYVKYLSSRLLPIWVLEKKLFDLDLGREVDYYDLCPKTPMIFFNHYWDGVPESPRWPQEKPIYLMPNIEMIELSPEYYWGVDVVLCKTQVCYDRVTRWYKQEGNPRNAQVFYTKHTSSDQAQFARKRLGDDAVAPKNFSNISFLHTAGTSIWKGTRAILDCWTSTADLPPLDVYINESAYNYMMPITFDQRLKNSRSPVNIHKGMMERSAFTKLTAEAAFFICPSRTEGYGHYINQARASGAVIITTDAAPMNELITSRDQLPGSSRFRQAVDIGMSWRRRIGNVSVDAQTGNQFPEGLPSADAGDLEVSEENLLHLSLLHEACVADENASLPWQFGSPGHQLSNGSASNPQALMYQNDTDLLQKLRQCPDVDIFLPEHLHGNGYCEDAVAYAKYLESRLLPAWILKVKLFDPNLGREVDYYDLCPKTPVIFFNHYWDGVPESPRWPKNKPIYLMPNIEMHELTAEYYWGVDVVLCKTQVCYERVTQWYEQEGNPRNTQCLERYKTATGLLDFDARTTSP